MISILAEVLKVSKQILGECRGEYSGLVLTLQGNRFAFFMKNWDVTQTQSFLKFNLQ